METNSTWWNKIAITLMVLTLFVAIYFISESVIPALAWGAILAIALRPLQKLLMRHTRMGEKLTSGLIVGILVAVTIGSFSALSFRVSNEVSDISRHIISNTLPMPHIKMPGIIEHNHYVQSFIASHTHVDKGTNYISFSGLTGKTKEYGTHILTGVHFISKLVETLSFTFLSLFCYLASYSAITQQIMTAFNKLVGREDVLLHIVQSIRGTVSGLVLVGIGEGILISPAFFFCGTPHPALMTILISLAAMIPFVGPVFAVIAGLMTYVVSGTVSAIIAGGVALFILFCGDHFVRPVFISGATKLPFLATLIGVLGGMHAFGIIGLFIGPSIMACGHMLWSELATKKE